MYGYSVTYPAYKDPRDVCTCAKSDPRTRLKPFSSVNFKPLNKKVISNFKKLSNFVLGFEHSNITEQSH